MPGDTTDTDRVPTIIKHNDARNCFMKIKIVPLLQIYCNRKYLQFARLSNKARITLVDEAQEI